MSLIQINPLIRLNRLSQLTKMATKVTMDTIKANAELTKQTISVLKSELQVLNEEYNTLRAKQLREENAKLLAAVETAKARLVQVEITNGIPQILLPGVACIKVEPPMPEPQESGRLAKIQEQNEEKEKPAPAKKEKKPAKAAPPPAVEAPVDIGRLDLRVGQIVEVENHPNADTLYLLKIDCGEANPRTVCSGLVKHITIDQLAQRSVVLLCNLKPVKMRGCTSEAMVMCASSPEKVEVLLPPAGSVPGDLIHCDGFPRQPDAIMNPKKKIFETVAPDLATDANLQACYKGVPLTVAGKGHVLAQTLKNVPVK